MFLNRLKYWSKTIGFRLAIWYSTIFILSSLALFVITYLLLSSSFQQRDRNAIRSKLEEYVARYQTGGITSLKNEVFSEKHVYGQNCFFVRFAEPSGSTVFLSLPDQWSDDFDVQQIEATALDRSLQWTDVRSSEDENVLELASTHLPDGYVLQVGKSTKNREELLETFSAIFSAVLIPMILIGFVGGQLLAVRALRPIRHLINTVRSVIETGKMELRIPSSNTKDELDELVILFNKMLGKIEILIRGMKQALDNVAHDLRTPMTRLRGMAEMALQSNVNHETCEEALADCLEESEHVLSMMNTLMDISEAEAGTLRLELQPVNISLLIEDVVELYSYIAEEKKIILSTDYPRELYIAVDPNKIRQALANLLDNAIKYTPSGGRVDIAACTKHDQVTITFKDTGIGVSQEEIPRIWDRLYRGDRSRSQRGLGLGLSLVKAIVQAHKGHVEVSSQPGAGCLFAVYLPRKG